MEIEQNKDIKKKKITIICSAVALVLLAVILFFTFVCFHEWQDATCTKPVTCIKCEKTQGEPLGHKWKEATCINPEQCLRCYETRKKALGHTESDWKTSGTDMVNATVTSEKYCTVCDVKLDEQTVPLKQLYFGSEFMVTPIEFTERINMMLDKIAGNTLTAYSGSSLDEYACGIFDDDDRVGLILFGNDNGIITTKQKNEAGFKSILGNADDAETYSNMMIAVILASDPTLDFETARSIAMRVTRYGIWTKNGITYSVEFPSKGAVFSMSIAE